MKFVFKLIIALAVILAGCVTDGTLHTDITISDIAKAFADDTVPAAATTLPSEPDTITIASFNIKWLSHKKAGDPVKGKVIADTLAQFDIIAIQEIRDSSDRTMTILEKALSDRGKDYDHVIGPQLPDKDVRYKERYAILYNTATIEKVTDPYTYSDSKDDFEREPFIIHLKAKNGTFDFVIVNIHTRPADAENEIKSLKDAITDARTRLNEPDIITLGDYNADCARSGEYYDESLLKTHFPETEFLSIIPNSADTNLASSDCTYDRIIVTSSTVQDYQGSWGVYHFDEIHGLTYDQAKAVSDHYPVWATFHINKDSD